jgi:c-di-GMP-binding flagellar brake protein YcgR
MPGYVELRPGQQINVQKDAGALANAFVSTIRHDSPVGMRIDIPTRGNELMAVQPGDDLMIMVDLQGRLYTFATRIEKIEPRDNTMEIERPRVVEQSERRQFFRLAMNIRPPYAAVVNSDGQEKLRVEAIIIDISGGGVQMRTKQPVDIGDTLHIVFSLGDEELEADLLVQSAARLDAEPPWLHRVNGRFNALQRRTQEQIIRFIFRQQVEFMKRGVR